ncbi:MAG: polysaccharide deacetylase family protein [Bacteroidetes bacterium]|nr:polysaccharide deacetylase family protein [Bacteroidota bacterium]
MSKLYNYLLRFILNCPEQENEILPKIAYGSTPLTNHSTHEEEFSNYAVVIRTSDFFTKNYGCKNSLPTLPLPIIENTPFFYGTSQIEKRGNTIIINADLIASAFVLLTRYEEWVQPDCRDEHGRFLAKHSIAYKGGFLHRPIIDEYGVLLRKCLREVGIEVPEPQQQFSKIYLTHDVDFLTRYGSFRGFCGAVWRTLKSGKNEITPAIKSLHNPQNDPFFTFPWILRKNAELASRTSATGKTETLFFLKSKKYRLLSGVEAHHDRPFYSLTSKAARQLISLLKKSGATIGLHTSYASSEKPEFIAAEKQSLEKQCNTNITCNRNHFLRSKNPTDMDFLLQNNILHDFTLGYADCAGFRLGTCRPVQYINVETKEVSDLILHPLLVMDCTLSNKRYMNLNENEAFDYTKLLIDAVKKYNGEIVLLWHNQVFSETEKYNHRELYCKILEYIAAI